MRRATIQLNRNRRSILSYSYVGTIPASAGMTTQGSFSQVQGPTIYYSGGSYFLGSNDADMDTWLIIYDGNTITYQQIADIDPNTDLHLLPSVFDWNGTMAFLRERRHNDPIFVYTQDSGFTWSQDRQIGSTDAAYPKPYPLGSNFKMIVRDRVNGTAYSTRIYDYTLNAFVDLSEQSSSWTGTTNERQYSCIPNNAYDIDGWYYMEIAKRAQDNAGDNLQKWYRKHLFKTQDFDTWYNIEETASHQLSVSGLLDEADWSDYRYFDGLNTTNGRIPTSCISDNGDFFSVGYNGTNYVLYSYNSQAGWQNNTISFGDEFPTDLQSGICNELFHLNGQLYGVFRVKVGDNYQQHIYRTQDYGVTWIYQFNPFPNIENVVYCNMTYNYKDPSREFLLSGYSNVAGDYTNTEIYLTRINY